MSVQRLCRSILPILGIPSLKTRKRSKLHSQIYWHLVIDVEVKLAELIWVQNWYTHSRVHDDDRCWQWRWIKPINLSVSGTDVIEDNNFVSKITSKSRISLTLSRQALSISYRDVLKKILLKNMYKYFVLLMTWQCTMH